jgi:hypothetical protein
MQRGVILGYGDMISQGNSGKAQAFCSLRHQPHFIAIGLLVKPTYPLVELACTRRGRMSAFLQSGRKRVVGAYFRFRLKADIGAVAFSAIFWH